MTTTTDETTAGPYERQTAWGGWTGENFGPLIRGERSAAPPTVLTTDDGAASLFYPGSVNMLFSPAGSCKTWLSQIACAQQVARPIYNNALFFDYEDGPDVAFERMAQLGLGYSELSADANMLFQYVTPDGPFDDAAGEWIMRAHFGGDEYGSDGDYWMTTAVIDGVTAAMSMQGLDPNVGVDYEQFLNGLPRFLARLGVAVILCDHTGLGGDVRRPIGSERKLSGIDGAAYGIETVVPFGRGRTGRARSRLRRDKHGHIARLAPVGKTVAEIELRSDADTGAVTYSLTLAGRASGGEVDDVEALTDRTLTAILDRPGISKRELREMVGGNAAAIDPAIEQLVGEELIRVEIGERGRLSHYPIETA